MKVRLVLQMCALSAAVLLMMGCPKDGTDSGTDSTVPGTDSTVPGTDSGGTDAANTDAGGAAILTVNVQEALDPTPQMDIAVDLYALAAPTTSIASGNTGTTGSTDLTVPAASLPVDLPIYGLTGTGYKDTFTFFPSPETMSRVVGSSDFVRIFGGTTWTILAGALTAAGGTEDATRGFLSGAVRDATGAGVSGATVSVDTADGTSVTMYIDAATGLPGTGVVTDTDGEFIIFNIPAGAAVVTTDAAGGLPTTVEVVADAVHLMAVIAP